MTQTPHLLSMDENTLNQIADLLPDFSRDDIAAVLAQKSPEEIQRFLSNLQAQHSQPALPALEMPRFMAKPAMLAAETQEMEPSSLEEQRAAMPMPLVVRAAAWLDAVRRKGAGDSVQEMKRRVADAAHGMARYGAYAASAVVALGTLVVGGQHVAKTTQQQEHAALQQRLQQPLGQSQARMAAARPLGEQLAEAAKPVKTFEVKVAANGTPVMAAPVTPAVYASPPPLPVTQGVAAQAATMLTSPPVTSVEVAAGYAEVAPVAAPRLEAMGWQVSSKATVGGGELAEKSAEKSKENNEIERRHTKRKATPKKRIKELEPGYSSSDLTQVVSGGYGRR